MRRENAFCQSSSAVLIQAAILPTTGLPFIGACREPSQDMDGQLQNRHGG